MLDLWQPLEAAKPPQQARARGLAVPAVLALPKDLVRRGFQSSLELDDLLSGQATIASLDLGHSSLCRPQSLGELGLGAIRGDAQLAYAPSDVLE